MIGKNFYFDGKKIPWTAEEGRAVGWYAELEVMNVNSDSEEKAIQGNHGVISYPTFARSRVVKISGVIFGTKEQRGEARKKIEEIFRLPFSPKNDEAFKELRFEDDEGTAWKLSAKLLTLPEYRHDMGEFIISFSFSLLAKNPVMYSVETKEISGNYGRFLGATLPCTLPVSLSGSIGEFSGENEGNFPSPTKITITGNIVNPKITNLTTGIFWQTETTISGTDILEIDCFSQTIKKNGVDILANRVAGSAWIFHTAGTNYFLLSGENFDADNTERATASIEFYDTRL